MEIWTKSFLQFIILIVIFLVLTFFGRIVCNKLKNKLDKSIDMSKFLPEDEIHTLKQVFYLIIMGLCIENIFYSFIGTQVDSPYFILFDVALSLYFAILLEDVKSRKNIILWLLLVPYGSLSFLFTDYTLVLILGLLHVFVFIYFAKVNLYKFIEYTNSNGLGITIILLFAIIFTSFFITQYSEGVNALDSLVIVSNQFTGNGYSVFGQSISGKLNSLLLVWGGYIISGAGAATLTAALLIRHFKKEFAELRKLIEEDEE